MMYIFQYFKIGLNENREPYDQKFSSNEKENELIFNFRTVSTKKRLTSKKIQKFYPFSRLSTLSQLNLFCLSFLCKNINETFSTSCGRNYDFSIRVGTFILVRSNITYLNQLITT